MLLDNFEAHVTLPAKGCQEDGQAFKALTWLLSLREALLAKQASPSDGWFESQVSGINTDIITGAQPLMEAKSLYSEGHLFVAAIRILERRHSTPPDLEQIAELLNFSPEQTGLICRRLRDSGIIDQVEGAFGDRWVIADHLKLEELPRDIEVKQLDSALKKFQSERNKIAQKIESIKEQQAQKRKDLFAGLEKKLKKDLSKD